MKWPKATPAKKRTVVTKYNNKKPRKVNVGYYPPAFHRNWVEEATFPTQPKAAQAVTQASSVPTQQKEASFTFMQPATDTATVQAAPNAPVTIPSQTQKMSGYCVTCTLLGKQFPTNFPISFNPNWSNSEEQEDLNGNKQ